MTRFFTLAMLVALLIGGVAGVAAENVTDADADVLDDDDGDLPDGCDERIDQYVVLCGESFDGETVTLELYGDRDRPQPITLTEWSLDRGHKSQTESRLLPEQITRLSVDVSVSSGHAGVDVGTTETVYSIPFEEPSDPFVPGSARHEDAAIAAGTMFGLFAIGFPASVFAVRRVLGGVNRVW